MPGFWSKVKAVTTTACNKVGNVVKTVGTGLKNGLKCGLDYGRTLVNGAVGGHGLAHTIFRGTGTFFNTAGWVTLVVGSSAVAGFKRIGKQTTNKFFKVVGKISKEIINSTKLTPLLFATVTGLGLAGSSAMLPLLIGSFAFSATRRFFRVLHNFKSDDTADLSRWGKLVKFTDAYVTGPAGDIVKRMGQGAVFTEILRMFIGAFDVAAATNPWLRIFIIAPAGVEALRLVLEKKYPNFSAAVVGVGEGQEKFAFATYLEGQSIARIQGSLINKEAVVSDKEGFICMGVAMAFAWVEGIIEAIEHKRDLKEKKYCMDEKTETQSSRAETARSPAPGSHEMNSMFSSGRGTPSGNSMRSLGQPLLLDEEGDDIESTMSRGSPVAAGAY